MNPTKATNLKLCNNTGYLIDSEEMAERLMTAKDKSHLTWARARSQEFL